MARFWGFVTCIVVFIAALLPLAHASTPTLFCKCAYKYNSSIIPINMADSNAKPGSSRNMHTCSDCNRKLCKDYRFKWLEDVDDEEIMTTCFQRDSAKDQTVVYSFILITVGLLVYAGIRPWVEKKSTDISNQERGRYASVPSQNLQ